MTQRNIAILGGTFDPVHNGHLKIASEVLYKLDFNQVLFIPNHTPPHRCAPIASPEQRLAMLELALNSQSNNQINNQISNQFKINTVELDNPGPSYMLDTVTKLKQSPELSNSNIWLILGLDAFYGLPSWYKWQDLTKISNFIIVDRVLNTINKQNIPDWAQDYLITNKLNKIENNTVYNGKALLLEIDLINISATQVRAQIKKLNHHENTNNSLLEIIPSKVYQYILQNNLYN